MTEPIIVAAGLIDSRGWGGTNTPWREWKTMASSGRGNSSPDFFAWADLFDEPWRQFGRSDPLTKIAVAAVELLRPSLANIALEERDEVGVYMGTTSGSLEIDGRYCSHLETEGRASPIMFTYTLPSTPLGAIAMRHQLRGPITCLVSGSKDHGQVLDEALRSIRLGEAETIVCVYANAVQEEAARFAEVIDDRHRVETGAYALLAQSTDAARRAGMENLVGSQDLAGGIVPLCERLCVPEGSVT